MKSDMRYVKGKEIDKFPALYRNKAYGYVVLVYSSSGNNATGICVYVNINHGDKAKVGCLIEVVWHHDDKDHWERLPTNEEIILTNSF